ncbi:MAG: Tetratricopeptide 2 repeat-containing protein [Firmicutes bacterium]|nr:Tetratricopeptide 2 repeat-containing protein [Bacillota bacterium]
MVMFKVDYIAITFLSIVLSIFFAFKIMRYLGLQLNIKPLILCAFCALAINFCLPIITVHFSQYHLPVILGITIISSFFITRYNARLTLNQKIIHNLALEGDSLAEPTIAKPLLKISENVTLNNSDKSEIKIAEIAKPKPKSLLPALKLIAPSLKAETTTFALASKQKTNLNMALIATTTAVESIQTKQVPVKAPLYLVKNDLATLPVVASTPTKEPKPESKFFDLREEAKKQKKLAIVDHIAKLETLDALLDYALDQRDNHEQDSSLYAFKKALKLYQTNDYAPFIVIEIGNIYKNSGLYDDAIVIYNKALKLPALVHNDELKREFINNIAYLRIVKNALLRRNITRTPFKDISQKVFSEIETEFQNWRTQNL